MADETKPLDTLKSAEQSVKAPELTPRETRTETISPLTDRLIGDEVAAAESGAQQNRPELSTDSPASDRLREFEDREFGKDAVRMNGRIERGYGSRFRDMAEANPAKGAVYAALERLVETELAVADATGKLAQAQADHDAAEATLEKAEGDVDAGA